MCRLAPALTWGWKDCMALCTLEGEGGARKLDLRYPALFKGELGRHSELGVCFDFLE